MQRGPRRTRRNRELCTRDRGPLKIPSFVSGSDTRAHGRATDSAGCGDGSAGTGQRGCPHPDPVADAAARPGTDGSAPVRRAEARLVAARAHAEVARRFAEENLAPVLDVGCGEGALSRALSPRHRWVGLDRHLTVLAAAPRPAVAGDATALPFADRAFAGAAALYVMHHLKDPNAALKEVRRVLRREGIIAVATVSRWDSPEFGDLLDRRSSSFDAEDAPAIVAGVFADIEVRRWDAPLVTLQSKEEIARYLIGRGVENDTAQAQASQRTPPLPVTKRGCLVFARKSV